MSALHPLRTLFRGGLKVKALDDDIIDTPDGANDLSQWKGKNPVQVASRRTKSKNLSRK
jgi:hypothetical protein